LRVPALPAWRMAGVVLAIALGLVVAWEGVLAARGVQPAETPGEIQHWLSEYDRVAQGQVDVVLIGSSRIQIGVSPGEIESHLPLKVGRVANLGFPFSSSLPALRALAQDESFNGTVVAEILPVHFFGNAPSHVNAYLEQTARPRTYLRAELYSHRMWRTNMRSASGHGVVQELGRALAGDTQSADLAGLSATLHQNRWYEVHVGNMADSARQALSEVESQQFSWPGKTPTAEQWQALLDEVQALVETIEARGGRVLFLRMPSDRRVYEVEYARFPKAKFWLPFSQRFAGRCVHFEDDPVMRNLRTYDGSHLGSHEAVILSRRLAEILASRGR